MKKTFGGLTLLCVLMASMSAFAQDQMKPGRHEKERCPARHHEKKRIEKVQKERSMDKDNMKKDTMKHDDMKRDRRTT